MQQSRSPPAAGAEAFRQHAHTGIEVLAPQRPVGIGAAHESEQPTLLPFARRHLGGHLLRKHVEGVLRNLQAIQFAAAHRIQQRRAFHQFVAGQRKQPAFGGPSHRMAGAAHALQERIDGARRAYLANQIHIADVDAELQGRGRHQYLQFAALQPLLRMQAPFLG